MISVIISTHHGRLEFLKKAIESVKKQTFTDYEIIVADDFSNDGTEDYCKTQPVVYVRMDKHYGSDPHPKNEGIKVSKGEYLAFLDSDNQYRPDHLQALYNALHNSEYDGVYGDRMLIDLNNRIPNQIGIFSEYNPVVLLARNYIDTSDVLIKREAIYAVGGWDERYKKYVDWNLWVRMAKNGSQFKRVPIIITDYFLHDDMKSATVHTKNDDEKRGIFRPEWSAYDLEIDLPYLHEVKEPKVAIFSITKDRLSYTKDCFGSMEKTSGYSYDHYIVDNGSTDGTVQWLQKYPHVIYNKTNKGISVASNQAIEAIGNGYDIIIKVDNDCYFLTDNWLKEMVDLYKRNHMVCFSPYPEGLKDSPGGAPRLDYGYLNGHFVGITNHLGGLCHFAPATIYKTFRWNELDTLHGLQDLELSQWLIKHGYGLTYVEDIKVEHYHGTDGQHRDFPEYFELRKKEKITRYEEAV